MSKPVNSVDYWVDALIKDTDPELFGFTDEGLYYTTRNKRNYGRWMWDCGYNAGLINLQTKVNTYCVPQWISVKTALPERGRDVLVTDGIHYMVTWCEDTDDGVKWIDNFCAYVNVRFKEVTHWMPLPETPESEDDEEWKK